MLLVLILPLQGRERGTLHRVEVEASKYIPADKVSTSVVLSVLCLMAVASGHMLHSPGGSRKS